MPAFAGMTGGFKSSGRNRHSRASGNPAGVFGRRQWPGCGSAVRRVDFKLTHYPLRAWPCAASEAASAERSARSHSIHGGSISHTKEGVAPSNVDDRKLFSVVEFGGQAWLLDRKLECPLSLKGTSLSSASFSSCPCTMLEKPFMRTFVSHPCPPTSVYRESSHLQIDTVKVWLWL